MSRSAIRSGMTGCHGCHLVSVLSTQPGVENHCPRCGAALHFRKPGSVSRTWAFLVAACILYIPANMLPIMYTTALGSTSGDTIMSGVIYMWSHGSYDLAILIFIASFVVPLSKLAALFLLLISVQRQSTENLHQRAKLYRMVEFIGKWSMLDVYVASLLTALVSFGALMNVKIGLGAIAFGSVVVLTMLAAHAFDPRLIWDPVDSSSPSLKHS